MSIKQAIEALPPFEDAQVQAVYAILCSEDQPPGDEHWEGFAARRIVAALRSMPAEPVGKVIRGEGGAFRFSSADSLLPIYALPPGEHLLYATPHTEAVRMSEAEIIDIAKNPMTAPCSPWWLKDDVVLGDVRNAAIVFARAVEQATADRLGVRGMYEPT